MFLCLVEFNSECHSLLRGCGVTEKVDENVTGINGGQGGTSVSKY